jgi:hypothetical protein
MDIHKMKNLKEVWKFINEILLKFMFSFSRDKSFCWFIPTVIGLMLRTDTLGVTSIIRFLGLNPGGYWNLNHFFHSAAWAVDKLIQTWFKAVDSVGMLSNADGRILMIGDGIKAAGETSRTPCAKRLRQESGDTSKPEHINGHMFGSLAVIISNASKRYALPISMRIHDGCKPILQWMKSEYAEDSHVTRLVREACKAAFALKKEAYLIMDRYFLSVPALQTIANEALKPGESYITLITAAKNNPAAYEPPVHNPKGRPQKKGKKVHLSEFFNTRADQFTQAELCLYGRMQKVKYLCLDMLWGDAWYQKLRFVLVRYDDTNRILVCTDLLVSPSQIIELYAYRFKIETAFRSFTQVIHGFGYHFWSRYVPTMNKFESAKETVEKLAQITWPDTRNKIISAYNAVEGFTMFNCIALGILQLCAIRFVEDFQNFPWRWLRTYSNSVPSEDTVADCLRRSYPRISREWQKLEFLEIIHSKKFTQDIEFYMLA